METTKMDPKIKKQWTKALRSGEYKQGRGKLRTRTGYCCLGVLCDITDRGSWSRSDSRWYHRGVSGSLPREIREELLITRENEKRLVEMNDGDDVIRKHTFKEIAAWIDENL